jgi:hypothetical protein
MEKMKKTLIYTLLSLALFSGCKKDNENLIDGKRPEQRLEETLTQYNDQLTGSTYGWKGYLYPDGGGGYSFYFSFDKQNRVVMYGDMDSGPAQTSMESSYRIKVNQGLTLSFDTYSYLHLLSDPDPNVFGGIPGGGYYSDFEFTFNKETGDTLKLTGKLFGSKLVLVKATKAESDQYNAKGLYNSYVTAVNYMDAHSYLYVTFGDAAKIQTTFNYSSKMFSLTWDDKGTVVTKSAPFVFTLTGMLLQDPVFYNDQKITEFFWDAEKGQYYANVGGTRINVLTSATPILPLHSLIGISYSAITVPNATTYPGWSADFVSRRAAAAATMLAGPYKLRLDRMVFSFNTLQSTLNLTAYIFQNTSQFTGVFPYTYTKTSTGVYKFTAGSPTGNGSLIVSDMAPLTTQRLNADQFTLDYFVNPSNGQVLGQFKSVQHPEFTFSGALQ